MFVLFIFAEDIINDDEVDINISWYLTMCIQVGIKFLFRF